MTWQFCPRVNHQRYEDRPDKCGSGQGMNIPKYRLSATIYKRDTFFGKRILYTLIENLSLLKASPPGKWKSYPSRTP